MDTQQSHMHDLRKENFVTQGAFRAAQLCKADQGAVKSQHGKLDLVCKLLVAAGILEEGAASGLCVRERKEESKSDVIQQVTDGPGTAYLEDCLARADSDIERIEKASRAASDEARRATLMVSNACMQVDEKCQQVRKEFCDRLDESLEESGERIETNSTRIFHLAAEVEGLTALVKERGAAAKPLGIAREETGEVFSVEIADLPQQATATIAPPPQLAVERTPTEGRQKERSAVTRREKDEPEETQDTAVRRSREYQNNPRPGVLGDPCSENHDHPEASIRAAFLATSLQARSPPAWRRRHSTYVGRRVVLSRSKEGTAAARLVVGPMRPQEDRSIDDQAIQSSWAKASSWPLLANEAAAAAHRMQDVRGSAQVNTDAAAGVEGNHNSVRGGTPNLELVLHGSARPETTKLVSASAGPGVEAMPSYSPPRRRTPAIGDQTGELLAGAHRQDDVAQKSEQSEDLSESLQAGDNSTRTSDHRQPPPSPQSLARMTANEAAEALQGVTTPSLGRRVSTAEERHGSLSTIAAVGIDAGSHGARLACLVDTPGLWCPRDTWDDVGAAEMSSSEGSSTVVEEGRGQKSGMPGLLHQNDGLAWRQ